MLQHEPGIRILRERLRASWCYSIVRDEIENSTTEKQSIDYLYTSPGLLTLRLYAKSVNIPVATTPLLRARKLWGLSSKCKKRWIYFWQSLLQRIMQLGTNTDLWSMLWCSKDLGEGTEWTGADCGVWRPLGLP
jgi:hypothetical protein